MRALLMRMAMGAAALGAGLAEPPAAAAQADGEWNSPRALELVSRAQHRRQVTQADTGMADYQADARGYVYFYLDRMDIGERNLVKTDQVALDVYWKAPNLSKQRIIGLRDERALPTNIRYHEDHLTVVQDNFGDLIRLGDGDEVADVPHPASPGAAAVYHYRLVDSTSIRLPGVSEPVRVYKLEVRPLDPSGAAMVGSIFVDRRAGDIVRMDFTFTPVAYVDKFLDYINIRMENGLFKGRFWLPIQQQVELRRQLPELGLPAGGVIRGTMRVSNYRFNQGLDDALFRGRRVVSVPVQQREAFAFEEAIDAELREEGISPGTELGDVRRQAAELMGRRLLSGLPANRIDVGNASQALRFNRAEGLALGAGYRWRQTEGTTLAVRAGLATGPMQPFASVDAWSGSLPSRVGVGLYLNQTRDVGVGPAISGAMNTVTGLIAGYDFTDPYFVTGAEVRMDRGVRGGWTMPVRVRAERHRQATVAADYALLGGTNFRDVPRVEEGTFFGGSIGVRREVPAQVARGWSMGVTVDGGHLDPSLLDRDFQFVRPRVDAGLRLRFGGGEDVAVEGSAGTSLGDVPPQAKWALGGRGTVPGYAFRSYGGEAFAFSRATAAADLWSPFLRGRVFAAAGGAWQGEGDIVLYDVAPEPRYRTGTMMSVGAGVGILYDILRIDVARGLGRYGQWEVIVEANPQFWDFL
ncbi:MAG TPA: hypothetical protein VGB24_15315 [Longimicrobium sp.]|jgi:hypothetical protein|uniref:hypothetical protein n=1 Tax=Longimicrobium sp. TaxID=2029185 RepID=UPI002ED9BFCE